MCPRLRLRSLSVLKSNLLIFLLIMSEPNTILWSKRSLRQLRKLPASDAQVIYREAGQLKTFPDCQNIRRLKSHACQYRLRVGRYRLMFGFDGEVKIVSIEEVRLRDESTY